MRLLFRPVAVTLTLLAGLTLNVLLPRTCDAQSPSAAPTGVCDADLQAYRNCANASSSSSTSSECEACLAKYQKTNTTQLTCAEWKDLYCTYSVECKDVCPCALYDTSAASCLFSNCQEVDPNFCATDGECQPFNCPTSGAAAGFGASLLTGSARWLLLLLLSPSFLIASLHLDVGTI